MILEEMPVTWCSRLKLATPTPQNDTCVLTSWDLSMNVTLYGETMVKLRLLTWEVIFDDTGGPQMQSQMSSQDGDQESFDT